MTDKNITAEQKDVFKNGNESAALAAKDINFHVMGYYPITPSTGIPESIDEMKAEGEHEIVMIPADGEHGAAGSCFGAAAGGGRVLNATSANGLLFSMEQLPVQSGCRYPMVLNIVNRSVSGPLDIKCDHSDIMSVLNTGWIIMMAKDPQRVYDFNMIACRVGEHKDVRLPVMVSSDGFFTSHQKRKIKVFKDRETVQDFIGPFEVMNSAIDPRHPMTIGPYMNEPDLINNKKQQSMAMEKAYEILPGLFEEYAKISGREYSFIDSYKMEDAEACIFILNSAFDTACEAVNLMREKGKKVGAVSLTVIRPFPYKEIVEALSKLKAVCVADRQDSYGARGGNMSLEVKAALKDDPENKTLVYSRVYGIGGRELLIDEAMELLDEALDYAKKGKVEKPYEYFGADVGQEDFTFEKVVEPIKKEEATPGIINVEEKEGKLNVTGVVPRKLTAMPKRIVSGHGACPGCGIFPNLNVFLKGIEGDVVLLFHTGCGMVVTTGYPFTAHRVTYVHNLFQNGAATMSGLVEMYKERIRRGEISEDITFVMVTGDGGNDIGMGPTIGAAVRNHRFIILEYDNGAYMNTGNQLSFTTPYGSATSTSHVGPKQCGKRFHHKDTAQIMAATHIPYVFTGTESFEVDLIKKAAKAYRIAKEKGLAFGKVLSTCPLNWRTASNVGREVCEAAVNTCFFPLYEVEEGITNLTYNPEEKNKKVPMTEWLKLLGRTRHLTKPEYKGELDIIQKEVDRRWERIKALNASQVL